MSSVPRAVISRWSPSTVISTPARAAKTVQAIQPPSVSYAGYGHLSITPFIVEFLGFGGSDGLPANGGEGKRGGGQQPESGPQR
jgi:hypothetical protein